MSISIDKLIEEKTFAIKSELFKPRETFEFILSLLSQTSFNDEQIIFEVKNIDNMDANDYSHVLLNKDLPENLIGDKIRMTQILLNLIKMAQVFRRKSGGEVKLQVAFDYRKQLLRVHVMNNAMKMIDTEQA